MLHQVTASVNSMVRIVVINHPNTVNVSVYRKKMDRPDPVVGGLPTLGGAMVLDSEDEEDISYEFLGNGFMVPAELFQASEMMDRQDAQNTYADEIRVLIEPEDAPGSTGWFDIKKRDVVMLHLDMVRVAFEVVGLETTTAIPNYTNRYALNRRDDLDTYA